MCDVLDISTHSLTRRLTRKGRVCSFILIVFQLTASQGGWLLETFSMRLFSIFQLTASQGGWRSLRSCCNWLSVFQLTASQGGWRNWYNNRKWRKRISTHSLTRRLTIFVYLTYIIHHYFNSQPHKEADQYSVIVVCFNCISIHSLTRRLTSFESETNANIDISTHSLTRRLTGTLTVNSTAGSNFNSQPHKEADNMYHNFLDTLWYFNSQPHKEADDWQTSSDRICNYFNSQPHKEADSNQMRTWKHIAISTHSLTRRLTNSSGKTY